MPRSSRVPSRSGIWTFWTRTLEVGSEGVDDHGGAPAVRRYSGMALSHDYGRICEDIAARHLTAGGWIVLHRNFRFGHKEVDVIARRANVVAFVEVKGRSGDGFGHPLEAITRAKRAEIGRVAAYWIARFGVAGDVYRFDAIAVHGNAARPVIEHVEDAWRMGL